MKAHIAYYRVSTQRQGQSGLGLEAQEQAVRNYVAGHGEVIEAYIEVESGRHHTNRPQLAAALDTCRKKKATLVIAKWDRLARNVAFIANSGSVHMETFLGSNAMYVTAFARRDDESVWAELHRQEYEDATVKLSRAVTRPTRLQNRT